MIINIIFKEVCRENWEACVNLKVSSEQNSFVAPNWYSILQAEFEDELYPLGIYAGEILIGFLMYEHDLEDDVWGLSRLMIDEKYQNKGYGKAAVIKLLEILKDKLGSISFFTSVEPENIIAKKMYRSLGFDETGEILEGEELMVIKL
ncbi:GNAT family N-acetyltransferase [Clostridium polynesiense]|uniref:GNAT family N-acetyltransferase n=1 Tax=Clostridium polynesiense TaxID=1325933 RepID=UPI000AAEC3F1|nr:GNAT family N-acetyltransferase [Clostridium polynesiense]